MEGKFRNVLGSQSSVFRPMNAGPPQQRSRCFRRMLSGGTARAANGLESGWRFADRDDRRQPTPSAAFRRARVAHGHRDAAARFGLRHGEQGVDFAQRIEVAAHGYAPSHRKQRCARAAQGVDEPLPFGHASRPPNPHNPRQTKLFSFCVYIIVSGCGLQDMYDTPSSDFTWHTDA